MNNEKREESEKASLYIQEIGAHYIFENKGPLILNALYS